MRNNYQFRTAILAIVTCVIISFPVKAQTTDSTSTSSYKVTADLVSSYVWRGVLSTATPTPNFQPTLAFVNGGLEVGVWGSTDFTGSYKEADLYVSFAKGPLKFTITDYYWFNTTTTGLRYFNYKNNNTNHIFEGSVAFSGPQSFPVSIAANVMFAGADKKYDPLLNAANPDKQAYSTYFELGYAGKYFSPFVGITPADGYYGDGYGGVTGLSVVNIGATSTKALKITDNYSLPLKATLGFNPQKEDIYLVFGITF
ncbi:MAG: hypothetical protein WC384_16845 [Prolixibacteraceae bacterium]|jgi:hypothetical protein